MEFYALLAVVFVLVPEWLANTTLENPDIAKGERLRLRARTWQWGPELMLGAMTMVQPRQLARKQGLWGYRHHHVSTQQMSRSLQGWIHGRLLLSALSSGRDGAGEIRHVAGAAPRVVVR